MHANGAMGRAVEAYGALALWLLFVRRYAEMAIDVDLHPAPETNRRTATSQCSLRIRFLTLIKFNRTILTKIGSADHVLFVEKLIHKTMI